MNRHSSSPSPRLLRAAAAEREALLFRRTDVLDRRRQLEAELAQLDAVLGDVDERIDLINRLAGDQPAHSAVTESHDSGSTRESSGSGEELRGPDIRALAVKALLADPQHPEALHYRDWFRLLNEAGYSVAGKDPLAVFLTQLSRSPLVRRSTQSGMYELDLGAPKRLGQQLENLQDQLRALTTTSPNPTTDLASIRTARSDLMRQIDRAEKALHEAEHTLRDATEPTSFAAAG